MSTKTKQCLEEELDFIKTIIHILRLHVDARTGKDINSLDMEPIQQSIIHILKTAMEEVQELLGPNPGSISFDYTRIDKRIINDRILSILTSIKE